MHVMQLVIQLPLTSKHRFENLIKLRQLSKATVKPSIRMRHLFKLLAAERDANSIASFRTMGSLLECMTKYFVNGSNLVDYTSLCDPISKLVSSYFYFHYAYIQSEAPFNARFLQLFWTSVSTIDISSVSSLATNFFLRFFCYFFTITFGRAFSLHTQRSVHSFRAGYRSFITNHRQQSNRRLSAHHRSTYLAYLSYDAFHLVVLRRASKIRQKKNTVIRESYSLQLISSRFLVSIILSSIAGDCKLSASSHFMVLLQVLLAGRLSRFQSQLVFGYLSFSPLQNRNLARFARLSSWLM